MRHSSEKMKNREKVKPRITRKELDEWVEEEMAKRRRVNQKMADLGWPEGKERLKNKKQEKEIREDLQKRILETHDLID